ncbi:type IV pilus twitching motility protein PilT [Caminibacter pacificus]|uniref:Twitching motility protein PilT n=1 Tax=Caminibacter pacificus TaxID=1424653 RepID=A0AAJ4UXP2_9BACT|nr:type IV pilus twitching motility protein PilT [Caminibacter pacificus]QCI27960.1 type IV pilus twitching motility protein PilT [Caminibacter pacificus]ROR39860.1 twitching motility protein PilT [Caminibacter pacificus]
MALPFTLEQLLKSIKAYNASDLHLNVNSEPMLRIDGKLTPLNLPKLSNEQIIDLCYSVLTDKQKAILEEELELDFSFEIPGVARFRANYYYERENLAAAYRIIPERPLSLDELKAPLIFKQLIKREKGLILVTGPTGSGKSTTLAAMLNEINEFFYKHIITIEDPIEFVHEHKKSLFSQREVGRDTKSFIRALRASLREDPDVILIGEMRDKETIGAAITAAETGHLVFATLHTNSADQTINRIVNVFPAEEQDQIRTQLSMALAAVISQVLLPKVGGGRIAAHEIMINNPAIANLIRENKIAQIYSQMQLNQAGTGMQTMNQVLAEYVRKHFITKETAMAYTTKPEELRKLIGV